MKKLLILVSLLIVLVLARCGSKETYSRNVNDLPKAAQEFISQHFNSAISVIETDKAAFSGAEYEVTLANGTEIKLNGNGDWQNIQTPNNGAVPSAVVPRPIIEYVETNHKGASIVGIEKNKKGYEVELSNELEIEFNPDGGFVKYDK